MVHLFSNLVLILLIHFTVYATKISAIGSQWVDPQSYSPRLLSNRNSESAFKTSEMLKNQQQTNLDYNVPSLSMLAYSQTKLKTAEETNVDSNEPRLSMLAYSQTKLKPAGEKLKTSRLTVPINKQQQLQSRQSIQNHLEKQEQQQQLEQQQQQQFQQQIQQQSYLTQLRQQSLMRQALANNLKDSNSREQIQTLKAKNRNKSLRTLSAPRKFEDFERTEKIQRKQDYLRPTKFQNDFDSALTLSRRQNQQQQQQLLEQQQMLQNSMNYPFQFNYPQASSINTLAMSLNPNRLQTQSTSSETVLPTQQKSSIVRLSNLQAIDLLKRKKPTNHVLAALRQSKIDDDTDLISEAGRFSRRNKSFKFQFEKTKNNQKLEIDGNAEASLMNSNNQNQNENKKDQNEDIVIAKEENAPSVVLIKKISVPTPNTKDEILKSEEHVIESENELSNIEKDATESYINHLKDVEITESKNTKDSTSEIKDIQPEVSTNEKDALTLTKLQNSEETNENLKTPEQSTQLSNDDSEQKGIKSEVSPETEKEIKKTDAIIAPKVVEESTQKHEHEQNDSVNNEIEEEEEISTE